MKQRLRKLELVLEERRYWNNELMRHYDMHPEGCDCNNCIKERGF